jgi:hypothetical protein
MGEGKVARDGASPSVQTSREVQGEDFRQSAFTTTIRHKLRQISNNISHLMMAGLNLDAASLISLSLEYAQTDKDIVMDIGTCH